MYRFHSAPGQLLGPKPTYRFGVNQCQAELKMKFYFRWKNCWYSRGQTSSELFYPFAHFAALEVLTSG